MSSGFDDRVEARLIGLRMAADAPNGLAAIITGSSNISLSNEPSPLQSTDSRNSSSDQSTISSLFQSSSSSSSFHSNAPVTARR
jgi:hypothetical protein